MLGANLRKSRRGRDVAARVRWPLLAYLPAAVVYARARRKLDAPPSLTTLVVGLAPLSVAAAVPRHRLRPALVWAVHMWAYKVCFEAPYDRATRLRERMHVDYPIAIDTRLGMGAPPSQRLQAALRTPPHLRRLDWALSALYWLWEGEPHAVLAWVLWRRPSRWAEAAARMAATFDLTLVGYWAVPTAPPWWASEEAGRMSGQVRRVAVEVGRAARGKPRPADDHVLGSNPWAAMPSDHFATAVMAAILLAEEGPLAGGLGAAYALSLGFALVYLGEHYVLDLLAGLALAVAIHQASLRRWAPVRTLRAAWRRA